MPTTHKRRIGDTYDSGVSSNVDATVGTYVTLATDNILTDTVDLIVSVFDVNADADENARSVAIDIYRATGALDTDVSLATSGACTRTIGTAANGHFEFVTNTSGVATIQFVNAGTDGIVHYVRAAVVNTSGGGNRGGAVSALTITL